MAESGAAVIESNGTRIEGESTVLSQGRENTIEFFYFGDSVLTAREKSGGYASGRRTFEPVVIRKKVDKSSPLLAKSLCNNETVNAEFMFFRPSVETGETEHFFSVKIAKARIAFIKRHLPDTSDPAASLHPMWEEVGFVFTKIAWIHQPTGVEHEDNGEHRA